MAISTWLFVLTAINDWHGEPLGKISGVETIVVPEEVDLRVCQEGAAQPRTLHQQLEVDVVLGEEIKKTAHCLGHEEELAGDKEVVWFEHKKTAQELKNKKIAQLAADPSLILKAEGEIKEKNGYYRAKVKYWHRDDRPECVHFGFADPVDQSQGKIKSTKRCLGHEGEKKGVGDGDYKEAKKKKKQREQKYASDSTILSYLVNIGEHGHKNKGDFRVTSRYRHHDDIPGCDHSLIDNIKMPYVEKDRWTGTNDETLSLQNNPHCNLVKTTLIKKPGSRVIDDVSVFRDAWERDLLFSCEEEHSPCAILRKEGGVLVKKTCLSQDAPERCTFWEKTYDFGKSASYVSQRALYEEGAEPIYGLNGEFDHYKKHDKRSDFPEMMAAVGMMADMFSDTDPEKSGAFKGKSLTCRCRFSGALLLDCCKKGSVEGGCNASEQELAKARVQERCHFIGTAQEGSETRRVYCCFASKIARIVQEESRQQRGIGWGTPDAPDCAGIAIEDIAETIDFSEAAEDFSQ